MMKFVTAFCVLCLAPVSAQFHLTNALNLQASALAAEEEALKAAADAFSAAMESAVTAMAESENQRAYVEALEKGEPYAPDGTPIPENQDLIRPLDPRTPTDFGDPFARINSVEESIDSRIAEANLTPEQEALLASISTNGGEPMVYDDVHDHMMYLNIPPRHMCGVSLEHAADTCGPTCDDTHKFCIMGHVSGVDGFMNFMNANGQYENWGRCYPEVVCENPEHHELILDHPDGCVPHVVNNPCKNPCDCLRTESSRAECHNYCQQTDSFGIIQCILLRNRGKNIREYKVAKALGATSACDYNVFYEHPLMHAEVLEKQSLPGLFGTF